MPKSKNKIIHGVFAGVLACMLLFSGAFEAALSMPAEVRAGTEDSQAQSNGSEGSGESQSTETNITIARPFTHYFDEQDSMTTTVDPDKAPPTRDYWMPYATSERSGAGYNGGTNAGVLTVKGDKKLTDRGYFNPASTFDYTSIEAGGEVSFEFTFHKITKEIYRDQIKGKFQKYDVANCATRSLDGYSLSAPIGTGMMMVLKRHKGDNSWTKISGAEYHNLGDSTVCKYTPSNEDIFKGTYFRFVSAYQYYRYDHTASAFFITRDHYVFYSVYQYVTVYLARGGTALKFASDTAPSATFDLTPRIYEPYLGSDTLRLNSSTLKRSPSISASKPLGAFSLTGELIPAGENGQGSDNKLPLESKVPLYFYNGVNPVTFSLTDNSSYYSSYATTDSAIETIATIHNDDVKSTYDVPGGLGNKTVVLQGLITDETGAYVWSDLVLTNNKASISLLVMGQYEMFRAMILLPVKKGGSTFAMCSVCYFRIEADQEHFKNAYSIEDGTKAEIYAAAAASTLNDGSICLGKFTVSNNPAYRIEYAYNSQSYQSISWDMVGDSQAKTFSSPGKYRFRVTNNFMEVQTTTIYIFGAKEDLGKSTFFGTYNGLLDESKRVYAPSSRVPCYGKGVGFRIDGGQYLPGLYGSISRILSDGSVEVLQSFQDLHSTLLGNFKEVGNYMVSVEVGASDAAGDKISHAFYFSVVDEENYVPTVNYDLLTSGIFTSSFMTKVYVVDVQSAGAGKFRFVFPFTDDGYVEALDLAMEAESYDMEILGDGTYRYPKGGTLYDSRFAAFRAIKEAAKKRIDSLFLDAKLFLSEGNYQIENVFEAELSDDIYVVSDESVFASLVSSPIYINGFSFTQLRTYESSSVVMMNKITEEIYPIPYDTDVSTVLDESGVYIVSESNWCGTREWEVVFLAEGDVGGWLSLNGMVEGTCTQFTRRLKATSAVQGASKYYVAEVGDRYGDLDDVVTFQYFDESGQSVEEEYLLRELKGKIITGADTVRVTIRNRLGYRFSFDLRFAGQGSSFRVYEDSANPITYEKVRAIA